MFAPQGVRSTSGTATALAAGATIGAGVVGSTGTFTTLTLDGLTSTGNLTLALGAASALKIGIAGVGASLIVDADRLLVRNYANSAYGDLYANGSIALTIQDQAGRVQLSSAGIRIASAQSIFFSDSTTVPGGTYDTSLARLAAASLRQGLAPSATPVAQIFTLGEASRPGTDTNVAGASGTIRPGLGTGTGPAPVIGIDGVVLAASGSGVQSYVRSLDVLPSGVLKLYATASTGARLAATASIITAQSFDGAAPGALNATTFATPAGDVALYTGGLEMKSTAYVGISSGATYAGLDVSWYRIGVGIWGAGTGAASGAGSAWLAGGAGDKRLTAAVALPSATMVDLTDLTATLPLGKYTGYLFLPVNAALAVDGFQLDLNGGTGVVSSVHFGFASALGATLGTRTSTALATAITLTALADTSDLWLDIPVTMVVSTAGTIIPRAAKVADAGGDATIRLGGFFDLTYQVT